MCASLACNPVDLCLPSTGLCAKKLTIRKDVPMFSEEPCDMGFKMKVFVSVALMFGLFELIVFVMFVLLWSIDSLKGYLS